MSYKKHIERQHKNDIIDSTSNSETTDSPQSTDVAE
jgi:hypothetical protein